MASQCLRKRYTHCLPFHTRRPYFLHQTMGFISMTAQSPNAGTAICFIRDNWTFKAAASRDRRASVLSRVGRGQRWRGQTIADLLLRIPSLCHTPSQLCLSRHMWACCAYVRIHRHARFNSHTAHTCTLWSALSVGTETDTDTWLHSSWNTSH